ncbi:hypothetical protein [Pseudooceanicola sp. MF1-13]|uniref:hypothetical protein n=1 Tax=Pseudooceanicola sp. MF1-13 TaxID=3379095 RepID=UPI003892A59F
MLRKFACVLLMTLLPMTAYADCRDTVLGPDGKLGKYKWQGNCFKPLKGGCKPCGGKNTSVIPKRTNGGGICSREYIAEKRADGCSVFLQANYQNIWTNSAIAAGLVMSNTMQYLGVFAAACHEHDICYATPGRTKQGCDDKFRDNMKAICKHHELKCGAVAEGFYQAVKQAGQPSYDDGRVFAKSCKAKAVIQH